MVPGPCFLKAHCAFPPLALTAVALCWPPWMRNPPEGHWLRAIELDANEQHLGCIVMGWCCRSLGKVTPSSASNIWNDQADYALMSVTLGPNDWRQRWCLCLMVWHLSHSSCSCCQKLFPCPELSSSSSSLCFSLFLQSGTPSAPLTSMPELRGHAQRSTVSQWKH